MRQGAWNFQRAVLALSVAVAAGGGSQMGSGAVSGTRSAYAAPTQPGSALDSEPVAAPAPNKDPRPTQPPQPSAGEPAATALLDAQILDLDDKPVSLRGMRGKVVIVLHQDRHSSDQNQGFKDQLGQLVLRFPGKLQLIALAEVGGYNFWPARRYVKDALRPLRALGGALVACDWKGAVQRSYRLPARQSAVFVVGKDGSLQALRVGVLPAADAAALLSQIEALAGA